MANSDTAAAAEDCAKDAGAIVKCSNSYEYRAVNDEAAEQEAVALALRRRDNGERGFRGMNDKDVRETVESDKASRRPVAERRIDVVFPQIERLENVAVCVHHIVCQTHHPSPWGRASFRP